LSLTNLTCVFFRPNVWTSHVPLRSLLRTDFPPPFFSRFPQSSTRRPVGRAKPGPYPDTPQSIRPHFPCFFLFTQTILGPLLFFGSTPELVLIDPLGILFIFSPPFVVWAFSVPQVLIRCPFWLRIFFFFHVTLFLTDATLPRGFFPYSPLFFSPCDVVRAISFSCIVGFPQATPLLFYLNCFVKMLRGCAIFSPSHLLPLPICRLISSCTFVWWPPFCRMI